MEETEQVLQKEQIAFFKRKNFKAGLLAIVAVIVVTVIVTLSVVAAKNKEKHDVEISVNASLEKIVEINELSTFMAVYNGIATSMNSEKPEEIDYYVSYDAIVKAGIDFEKIKTKVDGDKKRITVTVPRATITDVTVDIASLDFIFYNSKTNTSSVTQAAYKLCEMDVLDESKTQPAIIDLAQQNAENVVRALIQPFVSEMKTKYALYVESEAAKQ